MFKEFQSRRTRFDNGLVFLTHKNHHLPLVSLNAFIRCGKDQNPINRPGLAALTARLIDEGTQKYSASELSELLESIGGEMTSFSERELTAVTIQVHRVHLELAIDVLSEMLRFPTFPDSRIQDEKRKVINHIHAMADDPQIVGSQMLNQWIYAGTPLEAPVLGTPEAIEAMDRSIITAFHEKSYGPQNTTLCVCGNFDEVVLEHLMLQYFEPWCNPRLDPVETWSLSRQTRPCTDSHEMAIGQVHIYLGHLGIPRLNSDFYALQVLDVILGGGPGFTSRIPRRLRDEEGLAYVTYSDMTGSAGLYPGRFVAYIGVAPENRELVVQRLKAEIGLLQEQGVSEEELAIAQDFLTGSFVFEFQSNTAIAKSLLSRELFSLDEDFHNRYSDHVRQVTREDLLRVARTYLDTVNYTTIFVGSV